MGGAEQPRPSSVGGRLSKAVEAIHPASNIGNGDRLRGLALLDQHAECSPVHAFGLFGYGHGQISAGAKPAAKAARKSYSSASLRL